MHNVYININNLYSGIFIYVIRILSRNEFLGWKMVRGKCALGRGLGPSPQESVSVPLSEHIYSSVSTGRQELSQCHYFKFAIGKTFGGEAGVFGGAVPPPPPGRLNPGDSIAQCSGLKTLPMFPPGCSGLLQSEHLQPLS